MMYEHDGSIREKKRGLKRRDDPFVKLNDAREMIECAALSYVNNNLPRARSRNENRG